jgi:nicotinamidase-related amidase
MKKKLENIGLIIVDMQNDFVLPNAPAPIAGAFDTLPRLRKVLGIFRQNLWPVFHVVRHHRKDGSDVESVRLQNFLKKGGYAIPGTPGCEIVDPLKPLAGEYIIVKTRFSAFMNTELDFILRRKGVTHIVVCGTQYPTCIRMTVFDGISFGYNVTLLTDATSARTPEIAAANILDIKNIGVPCITVDEFEELLL